MKKIKTTLWVFIVLISLPFGSQAQTQLINQGHLTSGGGFMVLNNAQLTNNGAINQSTGTVKMMGDATDAQSTIGGTTASTFNDLTISKTTNNVLLSQNITVNGTLAMEGGHLDLQNSDVTAQTITGAMASRYIKTSGSGQLKQNVSTSEVTFPIGNSTFNPVKITNSGTADLLGVKVEDQVLENLTSGEAIVDASINRVWHVSETTMGSTNLNISPQWNGGEELPNFDRSQAVFTAFEGGNWVAKNSGAATGTDPYTFTGTGISTIGAYSIGNIVCQTNGQAVLGIPAPTAGSDQLDICGMEVLLNASTPDGSTGLWSIESTNGANPIFDDAMNIASSLTGVFGGIYTLRWTVADGVCNTIFDEVQVSFNPDEDIPGGDGVQDCVDECIGGDDSMDSDNSGLPDDCDCSPTDAANDIVLFEQVEYDAILGDIIILMEDTLLRRADLELTSDVVIDTQGVANYPAIVFQAATSITLNPGFHAKAGSEFLAFIEDCLPDPMAFTSNEEATSPTQKQQVAQADFLAPAPEGILALQILPNIVKQQAAVKVTLPEDQFISIFLYNQQGQRVNTLLRKGERAEGTYYYKLDASLLAGGFYFLQVKGEKELVTKKFVVAR